MTSFLFPGMKLSKGAAVLFGFFISSASLFAFAPLPAEAANLISNPSLEQASASLPTDWSKDKWGAHAAQFSYPVTGLNGGKAAEVKVTRYTSGDAKWRFKHVPVEGGAAYRFSDYSKSNVETGVVAEYRDALGTLSYQWLGAIPASSGWRKNEIEFTTPAGTATLTLLHVIYKNGILAVDEYSLDKAGSTTPQPPPQTGGFDGGVVSFSFDDSWLSQYTNALPILQNKGVKGTFYITTEPVLKNWDEFMHEAEVRDIIAKGHEIGSHTVTHGDLALLSAMNAKNEIEISKSALEGFGASVRTLAYPYGSYNADVIALVKNAGLAAARTADDGRANVLTEAPYELKSFIPVAATPISEVKTQIDAAVRDGRWLIITFHEVDASGREFSVTPDFVRQSIDYAKSKGVRIMTVVEASKLLVQ